MLKVVVCLILITTSFWFLGWVYQVQPVEIEKDGDKLKPVESAEKIGDTSENDAGKNSNLELKKFYEHERLCEKDVMKYDNLVKTIHNYVQRYVNLFLITSNLRDHEVKNINEMITIDLEISLRGEDLIYLQGYSKSNPVYPKNFSKLDAIFYKIAKQKEKTLLEEALRQSSSFIYSFNIFSIFNNPRFYQFFPLLIALLVCSFIYILYPDRPFYNIIGVVNILLFWESLNLYWKRLKEVGIEIYVKNLELKKASEKCELENIGWYDKILNVFWESKCLEYHRNINKSAEEEVSLFNSVVDTYSYYLLQTPIRVFGASIRDLTGEVSSAFPWPFNYFVSIPLGPIFAVVILVFILIFYAKRIRLSFLGAAIEIENAPPATGYSKTPLPTPEMPKTVRVIRKLRPWTKSRFTKRMEVDLGKRRKLLKSSKSLSEIPDESEPYFSVPNSDLNELHVKDD